MMLFEPKKPASKILALILALVLLFHPGLTYRLVLADDGSFEPPSGDAEVVGQNQETGEQSQNTAESDSSEQTAVENNNQAEVINNVEAEANTGNNLIDDPVEGGSLGGENLEEEDEEPGESAVQADLVDEVEPEIIPETTASAELEVADKSAEGVVAENENTGEDSENLAQAEAKAQTEITNENEAAVGNEISSTAVTGGNEAEGEGATIGAGQATSSADVVNVANTNLVGENFWQVIINIFGNSDNDIDLTEIEGIESFDSALISVLASNENTGDGSVNIALAYFLSSLAVYNQNNASLTNSVDILATSGNNQADGDNALINTGEAIALLNLFNLVNTNLIGENWFFGVINIFGELEGDIILPYELQYLIGDEGEGGTLTSAINTNTGEGSTNQAQASAASSVEITNTNEATLTNDVSVLANSGENEIIGSGSIQTGNASAQLNLLNIVNTNIFGGRWLFLLINNFGNWTGELLGWWGHLISIGGVTWAWVRLPDGDEGQAAQAAAGNEDTGANSQNQASVQATTSLVVGNTNIATVENKLSVVADTGNNQIAGESALINTGNAQASANIFNFLNTNIIGNHWFFGIINIFDSFFGNIIFPRPDLLISVAADQEIVAPGEEITYTIAYKNQGHLWAKTVTVLDTMPPETTFVSASDGGVESGGAVTWNLGTLAKGEEGTLALTVKGRADVPDGSVLVNNVLIATTTEEPEQDNNSSSAFTTVMMMASISTSTSNSESEAVDALAVNGSEKGDDCSPDGDCAAPSPFSNELASNWLDDILAVQAVGETEEEKILGALAEKESPKDEDILPYILLCLLSSLWLVDRSRRMCKITSGVIK